MTDQSPALRHCFQISDLLLRFETRLGGECGENFGVYDPCKNWEGWTKCLSAIFTPEPDTQHLI